MYIYIYKWQEDEMVGWYHWLVGHEFEQAPGIGDGQGSLACFSSWCCKKSDTTEQLNWTELINDNIVCNVCDIAIHTMGLPVRIS